MYQTQRIDKHHNSSNIQLSNYQDPLLSGEIILNKTN
ncbi:unnamed protein product [Paramecium octaurelia]|uniref:Uncharacterized protein n=1 Tax=Paramecium octaurelia TaxID=43137 RepID=A0A8S1UPS2_PAROT|nr:unnamed protein product [Paramecium octaurelia]